MYNMRIRSPDCTKFFGLNKVFSLKRLLLYSDNFDLLGFWSNKQNQDAYPGIYHLARSTMAYMASTAFVESVFSLTGRLMTPVMSNYGDNTIEAMLLCKSKSHVDKRMAKVMSGKQLDDDDTADELDGVEEEE